MTIFVHLSSGMRINLGPEVGRGGEGAVYEVMGTPDLVAKVYTDGRADGRREKIEAMVAAGLQRQATHIAFPVDVLLDEKDRFVGFTMRRIKGARPIHQLWGSRDRREKFPDATVNFMVRVAGNAARAVGELHQAGCVIGDINESGFLVTDQATVVLIDSDSIQYTVGNRVFPCVVGTPQYLPPEHQGINQRQLGARTPNHDNFGLAVMIFRLLMAGTHPFMGKWNGGGDPPALPKWIEGFRYAYGADAARMKVGPQPAAPPVDWVSDGIRSAFDQAFGKSGVQTRPTASTWIALLDQFEASLIPCGRSRYHQHQPGTRSCPWCETEKTRGKPLFGPPSPPPSPPNFGQQPFIPPSPGATPVAPPPTPPKPNNSLRNTALAIIGVTIVAIWMFGGGNRVVTRPTYVQPQVAAQPTAKAPSTATSAAAAAAASADAAAAAAEAEAERIRLLPAPEVQNCASHNFANWANYNLNCEVVVFSNGSKEYLRARKGRTDGRSTCLYVEPESAQKVVDLEWIGGNSVRLTPIGRQFPIKVAVFELAIGETYSGFTCGYSIISEPAVGQQRIAMFIDRMGTTVWGGKIVAARSIPKPLLLEAKNGEIHVWYPDADCRGRWVASSTTESLLLEVIDTGRCTDGGFIRAVFSNEKQLNFEWRSSPADEKPKGWGVLQPYPLFEAGEFPDQIEPAAVDPDVENQRLKQIIGKSIWAGSVDHTTSQINYSVHLQFNDERIKVAYPEISCSGVWNFKSKIGTDSWLLSEKLNEINRKCLDGGDVVLSLRQPGVLHFEWFQADSEIREAWADLRVSLEHDSVAQSP